MTRSSIVRSISAFALSLLTLFAGCDNAPETSSGDAPLTSVRLQLDWYPEAQHGGIYQALAKGYFEKEGLDVRIIPGASAIPVYQTLGLGKADIGQLGSSHVILAAKKDLPVKMIASVFHDAPSVFMMHAGNPVSSFEELHGKTIMVRPSGSIIPYIKKTYGIEFEIIPQSYELTQFLADPSFIQEGFYISEFHTIRQHGVEPKALPFKESGFVNGLVLAVNDAFWEEDPEAVRGFVRAYKKGWKEYLEGDPKAAHQLMNEANKGLREVDEGLMAFSRDLILRDNLASGDPALGESIGGISKARFQRQIDQLEDLGELEEGQLTVDEIVIDEFAD